MKMSSSVKERNESKNDNGKAVKLDKQTYSEKLSKFFDDFSHWN